MTKERIRKSVLARREALSAGIRVASSQEIIARVCSMDVYRDAATVLGYMNIGAEFASDVWVRRAMDDGKRLALPRVNHHADRLDLYWVDDLDTQLMPGLWGIREPVVQRCERVVSANEVEFALLPGVAFCRNGARLGYGGGYYDKLLGGMIRRPVLAAAAFALQLVEHIPQDATDIRVDWIITEQETISCSD